MTRKLYPRVESDAPVYPRLSGYRMACCDCCLVHTIRFEIVRVADEALPVETDAIVDDPTLAIRMYVSRNNRSTGQLRRYNNIKLEHNEE